MKTGFINFFRNYNIKNKAKFRTKLYIFIVCIFIAISFWLFLSLGNNFDTTINLKIDYQNLPTDKTLTSNLPKQFSVQVNAKGFDLLGYYFNTRRLPITIDLSKTNLKESPNANKEFDISTADFYPEINNYLGDNIQILSINPDTIKLYFSALSTKKVPVRLNIELQCRKQFDVNGLTKLSPDSITVSGTKEELDTISFVSTVHNLFKDIDRPISEMIDIERSTESHLFYSLDKVYVTIPVEKFTEKTLEVPLKLINLKPKFNVKVIPTKVKVSFMVAISDYSKVFPDMFGAEVDFANFQPEDVSKMKVAMHVSPNYIKSMQIAPEYVDYLIIK
ncbi:MAG: hypothetical protein WCL14_10510 [Bacteroidota bacterium]